MSSLLRTRTQVFLGLLTFALTAAMLTLIAWTSAQSVERLSRAAEETARFERLRGDILRLDEMLTMSGKMAALTGEGHWLLRYDVAGAALDAAIEEVLANISDRYVLRAVSQMSVANQILYGMEEEALAAVIDGDLAAAQAVFERDLYAENKRLYHEHIEFAVSRKLSILQSRQAHAQRELRQKIGFAVVALTLLALALFLILNDARRRATALSSANSRLRRYGETLESRVKRRTEDLLKAKDAAEAADKAKSEFLASMSHEIRTPLNGVLGMTSAMVRTELDPKQREMLETIHESGRTLVTILNDVLDMSKIEAGRLDLEAESFDLIELSRRALGLFRAPAETKGLAITLHHEAEVDWRIGDPVRVRQVVYNLISNAVKFTDEGGVDVCINTDASGIEIVIRDTGIGMSKDVIDHLFEAFTQADASTTRKYGGTGLGLAISARLAERMGGDITVDSVLGEGSTFIFRAPLIATEPPTVETDNELGKHTAERRLRVLVAEDNPANRRVLKALLSAAEVDLVFAENGEAAIEAFETMRFDLILMDLSMPVMDGLQATARIRSIEMACGRGRTPIVAVTANAMPHHYETVLKQGGDGLIAKPIEPQKLFEVLEQAMAVAADRQDIDAA